MRKFHIWYDQLPHSKRFPLFMFGLVIPFIIAANFGMYTKSSVGVFGSALLIVMVGILAISRVRYIHQGKRRF